MNEHTGSQVNEDGQIGRPASCIKQCVKYKYTVNVEMSLMPVSSLSQQRKWWLYGQTDADITI